MQTQPVFEIDIHGMVNFSKTEQTRFTIATKLLSHVLNSNEFKQRVISFNYTIYKKCFSRTTGKINVPHFKNNKGFHNIEIYNMIISGEDVHNTERDNDMDVFVTLYYSNGKTIGYTYPSTFHTWINRKFFDSIPKICRNLIHEYMHNLDFKHSKKRNPGRQFTVPYAIGEIVFELVKQLLENYNQVVEILTVDELRFLKITMKLV